MNSVLENGIKKIASAPGGACHGNYFGVTRNSKYFAFSSHYSVFIYQLPEFTHIATLSQGLTTITKIRLCKTHVNYVAILYSNKSVSVYDFITRSLIMTKSFGDKVCSAMDFAEHVPLLLVYFATNSYRATMNVDTREIKESSLNFSYNVKDFSISPENENIQIFSLTQHMIIWANLDADEIHYRQEDKQVYRLVFDPLNPKNCLMITSEPLWKVITFMPEYEEIARCERMDIFSHCGDWVPAMPGHIVTGDKKGGILNIWSVSSGQIVESMTLSDVFIISIISLDPSNVAVAFKDGMIGVVNVPLKQFNIKVYTAHTNTIFSCNFLTTDPTVLVTGGADGAICLWSVPQMKRLDRFFPTSDGKVVTKEDHIYSICLSPGSGLLGAGTGDGRVIIYSMQTKSVLFTQKLHKAKVLGISWSTSDPNIIGSSAEDNLCQLFNVQTRKLITTISMKKGLRRLKWAKKSASIALACSDGSVYIRMEGGAYQIIKGGDSPLFDVAWNPFDENLIAATDDVGNVMVFDRSKSSSKKAQGHKENARPVVWSEEIEYLFFTGGYDGNLVLWDCRSLSKIKVVQAHSSHIYGISIHPDHPFLVATCSRDETVRLWSIIDLFPEIKIKSLLNKKTLDCQRLSPLEGNTSLVKLVHRVKKDGTKLSFDSDELCHVNDALRIAKKRISKLTSALPHDQSTLLRSKLQKQKVLEAADLSLKCGNMKRFCELSFLAGEYEKALSFAPAVSFKFWQNLIIERANMMKGTAQCAEYNLIAGNHQKAIQSLISINDYEDAMIICATQRDHTFQPKTKTVRVEEEPPEVSKEFVRADFDTEADFSSYKVASKISKDYATSGRPLLAAAALITVGDVAGAAWRLLHCGELMWAVEISKCIEGDSMIFNTFIKFCIHHHFEEDIFKQISKSLQRRLAPLITFPDGTERDAFYKRVGMKTSLEYLSESKRAKGASQINYLLLAGETEKASQLAIKTLRGLMAAPSYDFTKCQSYVNVLKNIPNPSKEVVAVCHYFGAYEAMWKGYDSIIERLIYSIKQLDVDWMSSKIEELNIAAALTLAKVDPKTAVSFIEMIQPQKSKAFEGLSSLTQGVDGGCTVNALGSGVIPIDMDSQIRTSACTNQQIKGNYFVLEDGKTAISYDEALMWFEVTPFSLLETHERLFPY